MAYQWSLNPPALTELASDLLGRIVEIGRREDFGPLQAFQDECLQLFATFDEGWRRACAPEHPEPTGSLVKYGLVAMLDEIVADSTWPHRHAWENASMELQLFGSDRRGKEFYVRLDKQVKSPDALPAALLTYYTCLLAGFRGQYLHDEGARAAVIDEVRERIAAPERVDLNELVSPLKPFGKPVESRFTGLGRQIQLASGAVLLLLGLIYLTLQWKLIGPA